MKERPILFSAPMILALLSGAKTQTRRIVKPDPGPYWNPVVGIYNPVVIKNGGYEAPGPEIFGASDENQGYKCPYGQPGDQIYVRETFFAYGRWETRYSEKKKRGEWHFVDMTLECDRVYQYAADNPDIPLAKGRGPMPGWWTRPAIFMPRAASRIRREIVSVRVERLNDISEEDAQAEGVEPEIVSACCGEPYREDHGVLGVETYCCGTPIEDEATVPAYRKLWESLNGAGSWAANPWVWVIAVRRLAC